jgi:hypothetical protein
MLAKKAESKYLTYDFIAQNQPVLVEILDEAREVRADDLGKDVFRCTAGLKDGKEKTWTINATCWNKLIDAFGPQTTDWIGKSVNLTTGKSKVGGRMVDVITQTSAKEAQREQNKGKLG